MGLLPFRIGLRNRGTRLGYRPEYTYERLAQVRTWALPFHSAQVRKLLDKLFPTWDEYVDWSLLLDSFFLVLLRALYPGWRTVGGIEWHRLKALAEDVLGGKRAMTDPEIVRTKEKYTSSADNFE